MEWVPAISEWPGPLYMRIVDAMAADIAHGRLARGQQLPTHRALAKALNVDLTTVTRAYSEARRRGLLDARVGSGTFVSETTIRAATDMPHQAKIDLSMNVPPHPVEANLDVRIAQGLSAIQDQASFTAFLNYQRPGGSDEDRHVAAEWLRPRLPKISADKIIVYPGSQAALFNSLLSMTSPGDVILTEALTFPGIRAAAAKLGVQLIGVAMDDEGVRPDALKRACDDYNPKAVYLVPTLHNPTTATMGPSRRKAVAEVIRAGDIMLIEDDAYGFLEPTVSPIANLIPERTYLPVSLSKCIAPALRVSYLIVPDAASEQIMRASLQATMQMPPPLMVALVTHWIKTGVADQIITAIRNEAAGRQQLASRILNGASFAAGPTAHHLWLSLPRQWSRADFISQVLRDGLAVVGAEAFSVTENSPHAVRVSLGAARNRAELSQALHLLAETLRSPPAIRQIV
ncbi:PLP-dependent aminotransferase family protein [Pseudorhodoplanes sinuspersici]|uniref:Transcriptional regulator n=1 Tax=Pseudorhodoplanes sinuspersici TaxID=1235591 RepID=A0A1W6ZM57_9HYPH|nr:PLP-dependent aminotransferase family protein [Pseudorhodoplanes sinuspersici]ARP98451.1 transcriptional regulator [Pseudorhodoplanes sinuspersici]RKE66120.1 GntR family transcriptional regulator [Pseudorhodoplanes sinuspersici]